MKVALDLGYIHGWDVTVMSCLPVVDAVAACEVEIL